MTARPWVFTLNNPTGAWDTSIDWDRVKYFSSQHELGETGTEHIQGYVVFKSPVRLTGAISALGVEADGVHFEVRRGSHEQADDYVRKDGGWDRLDFGTPPAGIGSRTDISHLIELVEEGLSDYEISINYPQYIFNFSKKIESLRTALASGPPEYRERDIIAIIGPTGCGKTKFILDNINVDETFWLDPSNGSLWYDGYHGQPYLIIDNFTVGYLRFNDMCRILDRTPNRLAVKGGFVGLKNTTHTIIVTSTLDFPDWYKFSNYNYNELKRRFGVISYLQSRVIERNPIIIGEFDAGVGFNSTGPFVDQGGASDY